jgi:hypothetical protein
LFAEAINSTCFVSAEGSRRLVIFMLFPLFIEEGVVWKVWCAGKCSFIGVSLALVAFCVCGKKKEFLPPDAAAQASGSWSAAFEGFELAERSRPVRPQRVRETAAGGKDQQNGN